MMVRKQQTFNSQYGYRQGYGTIDDISHIVTDIQICRSDNKYIAGVFLDIKGTYDCVDIYFSAGKEINFL